MKADGFFQEANYVDALKEYQLLLKRNPHSALYLYRYARCAQELGDYMTAIEYFDKSGNRYALKHFHLGEIYMRLWHIDQAIMSYTTYLMTKDYTSEREEYVRTQIAHAEKLQRYLRRVEKVEIIDSVDVSLDSLLCAYQLSLEAGELLYDSIGNVVFLNQRKDRKFWGAPCDSIRLILSSNKLMNTWTSADTLPPEVNLSADQNYPYVLSDGLTLYFAAKDTNGLGGYDIFVSRYNTYTNTYTIPENIGFPYNSSANDYLMVLDELHQIGYFATDRFSKSGSVRVYSFVIPEQKQYWRNLSLDSLAAYAQLRYSLSAKQAPDSFVKTEVIEDKIQDEIFFILNDSTVYTSLHDFRSHIARKQYQEWEIKKSQTIKDRGTLHNLRVEYGNADNEKKKKLTPLILQLENQCSQSIKEMESLLRTVRITELQVFQQ